MNLLFMIFNDDVFFKVLHWVGVLLLLIHFILGVLTQRQRLIASPPPLIHYSCHASSGTHAAHPTQEHVYCLNVAPDLFFGELRGISRFNRYKYRMASMSFSCPLLRGQVRAIQRLRADDNPFSEISS